MEFYIRNAPAGEDSAGLGSPVLLYAGRLGGAKQPHPRNLHSHQDMVEVLYLLDGPHQLIIDGRLTQVQAGDIVVYGSGVLHDEVPFGGPMLQDYYFAASGIQLAGLPPNQLLERGTEPVLRQSPRGTTYRRLFELLYEEAVAERPRSLALCNSLMNVILNMVLDEMEENARSADTPKDQSQLAAEVKRYINDHYAEALSVSGIAEVFGLSTSYLSHQFKRATGQTLVQYIMRRRIGEAQTLLISTSQPVRQIATAVGYHNISHFNVMFARSVGATPLQYRKSYRNPAAAP